MLKRKDAVPKPETNPEKLLDEGENVQREMNAAEKCRENVKGINPAP